MERMVDGARRYPRRVRSGWAVLVAALLTLSSGLDATARNRGADGKFEKRVSSHFALYQDVAIDRTSGFDPGQYDAPIRGPKRVPTLASRGTSQGSGRARFRASNTCRKLGLPLLSNLDSRA